MSYASHDTQTPCTYPKQADTLFVLRANASSTIHEDNYSIKESSLPKRISRATSSWANTRRASPTTRTVGETFIWSCATWVTQLRCPLEKTNFHTATVAKVIFGPNLDTQRRTVKGILDPLNSNKCNAHLLVFIFDAILITIFPELALGAVGEGPEVDGNTSRTSTPQDLSNDHNDRPLSGVSLFDPSES